ncbi:MAG: hypothetical protein V7603_6863, partial [Micromonosporaceae bacterium]
MSRFGSLLVCVALVVVAGCARGGAISGDAGSDAAGAPTDLTGLGMSCDGGLRVPEPRASVGPGPRPLPA